MTEACVTWLNLIGWFQIFGGEAWRYTWSSAKGSVLSIFAVFLVFGGNYDLERSSC